MSTRFSSQSLARENPALKISSYLRLGHVGEPLTRNQHAHETKVEHRNQPTTQRYCRQLQPTSHDAFWPSRCHGWLTTLLRLPLDEVPSKYGVRQPAVPLPPQTRVLLSSSPSSLRAPMALPIFTNGNEISPAQPSTHCATECPIDNVVITPTFLA